MRQEDGVATEKLSTIAWLDGHRSSSHSCRVSEFIERLSFAPGATYSATEAAIHTSRYLLARAYCSGKKVLDVSCGEGYGSYLMAKHWGARAVDGVDLSAEAIDRARQQFQVPEITWWVHDALRLTEVLTPASYDLVVSLETIEHLPDPGLFLDQIKALLKPDGVAIISCPNDHWYYPDETQSNPFHLRKFTFSEFSELIEARLGSGATYLLGTPVVGYGNFPCASLTRHDGETVAEATLAHIETETQQICVSPPTPVTPEQSAYYVAIWAPGGAQAGVSCSVHPLTMDERHERQYVRALEAKLDEHIDVQRRMEAMIQDRDAAIRSNEKMIEEYAAHNKRLEQIINALQAPAVEPEPADGVSPVSALIDERLNEGAIEAVFTDVFDTLILRQVHPEHTKRLAAKRLALALGGALDAERIYQLRSALERAVCLANEAAGFDAEFRFDEQFTEQLLLQLSRLAVLPAALASPSAFHALCVASELEAELEVQTLDRHIVASLARARSRGVRVFALSDFYWPRSLMQRLFERHGLDALFENVFVSSEHKLTKRSGRLYDRVLEELGLSPSRVLMIGDNAHSDDQMARSKGLHTIRIERPEQHALYEASSRHADEKAARALVAETLAESCRRHAGPQTYFPELALTLFSFIEKLYLQMARDGVRDAFFLSREGEFLQRLFERYQDVNGFRERGRIRTHYLIASRKSTFIASLGPLSQETFDTLFRQYRALSVRQFLKNLNFTDSDIAEVGRAAAVHLDQQEADLPGSAAWRRLLATKAFQDRYEDLRREQRALIRRYVAGFGVDVINEGMRLVDVGWKGTMQDHLHRIFDGRVAIDGYYLGLIAEGAAGATNRKRGVLFSTTGRNTPYASVFNDNRALFEILLAASHGSADRYVEEGDAVKPVLLHLPQEREIYSNVIKPIQDAIGAIFDDLARVFSRLHFTADRFDDLVARTHARFTFTPTTEELTFFIRLHHYENFGTFDTSRFLSGYVPLTHRLRNLVDVVRSPDSVFERGWWAPLTLRQLGLDALRRPLGRLRYNQAFRRQ